MRPITVSIGPLAAASATKISASQSVPAAQAVVIDGAAAVGYVANNIATAQSVSGAAAVTLNGSLVSGGVAVIGSDPVLRRPTRVVIVSAANDSGITFTVSGLGPDGVTAQSETVTGANTSRTSTVKSFYSVSSITTSGSTAGNITVGTNGRAVLDVARRVLLTSGGDDSGLTFTVSGLDSAGNPISETLAGGNTAAVYTALDYAVVLHILASGATASTLTVGTNGIASSLPIAMDPYALAPTFVRAVVSGTVNYTVEQSADDPNSPTNPVTRASMSWDATNGPIAAGASSASAQVAVAAPFFRVTINSGTGSVIANFVQSYGPTF